MISGHKLRTKLATIFQWVGALIGLLIMGSCSAAGFQGAGAVLSIGLILAGIAVAIFVAGWIFLVAGLCKDVIVIRRKLTNEDKPGTLAAGSASGKQTESASG